MIWLSFAVLAMLFVGSKEAPLDESEESNDSESQTLRGPKDSEVSAEDLKTGDRQSHSRMLGKTPTTLGYDEWWFFTTRRPFISYKDYPGKPGVATWKEISSPEENKKSKSTPTAAGVSSGSWTIYFSHFLLTFIVLLNFGIL